MADGERPCNEGKNDCQMQMMKIMLGPEMHPLPPQPLRSHHRIHNDPSSSSGFNFGTKDYPSFSRPFEDDQCNVLHTQHHKHILIVISVALSS